MRSKYIVSILILSVVCMVVSGCVLPGSEAKDRCFYPLSDAPAEVVAALHTLSETLLHRCTAVDENLTRASLALSHVSAGDVNATTNALWDLYLASPENIDVARVSADGVVCCSVPVFRMTGVANSSEYWEFDEASFLRDAVTILSGPHYSEVHGEIMTFRHPVFTAGGVYDGYVSISFLPSSLLGKSDEFFFHSASTTYFPAIFDANGTILYYPNEEFIGSNAATLPAMNVRDAAGKTAAAFGQREGMIKYQYYPFSYGPLVDHVAVWETVSFGGRELRPNIISYERVDTSVNSTKKPMSDKLVSTVSAMYLYAKDNGIGSTCAIISDPNGKFSGNTDFTLFAYATNGTSLATSRDIGITGKNRLNAKGSYGLRYVNTMIDRCHQGGGFVHYYLPVGGPASGVSSLCIAYVLPVNSDWFVGAAQPLMFVTPDMEKREKLSRDVMDAQQYIRSFGKDAAIAEFINPASIFQKNTTYILALAYNGTVLSAPVRTELTGANAFGFTDPHGSSVMRELVILAKGGGGYMLLETEDPDGTDVLNLLYVEPVDDQWCISSWVRLNSLVALSGGGES